MKNKIIAVFISMVISLFWCLPFCQSQDLTGDWVGTIKKNTNENAYYYEMTLKGSERKIKGESITRYKDEEWYCRKKVNGIVVGKFLAYKEQVFIEHHHERGAYWLLVEGRLKYDAKEDKLCGWVDAFDPYTYRVNKRHDYVELYRKKIKYANLNTSKNCK